MNLDSAIFYSKNIEKIVPFYRDTLGFTLEYKTERFVYFIFPNGVRLGIKNQTKEREVPGHQTAFISVKNIEELHVRHKGLGLNFYTELTDNPWGKEYSILDADKNKILFLQKPTAREQHVGTK